jgi:hypothetical protein
VIDKPFESVEDLARDNLFAGARDEPVVKEDRRSGVA